MFAGGPRAAHGTSHRTGIALAVLAAFGFSFKAILVKLAYPYGVDAITLLALRMAFALPVFLWVGFSASKNAPALSPRDWLAVAALGVLGYYGASILDFLGLKYISAGLERLILFTYPTLTLLFGVALHGRAITRREGLALALCYVGIAAAFAHDLKVGGGSTAVWIGGGFVFASSVSYALYLSGSAGMIAKLGAARFTALAMLVSTAATGGHFLATQPLTALVQPWPVYALGLAMGLFSTVLPVFAQSAAIRRVGSGQAALVGMVGPLLTIVFAWLLLDEGFSTAQMIGVVLVIVGVATVSRR
ncbi:MAG: DMT family transporter [Sulfuritalea sp.]|jgi:drug/metabolite transporter (DMT)-like permease|nr:DMT family transporter [Sulfuritalea sp.]